MYILIFILRLIIRSKLNCIIISLIISTYKLINRHFTNQLIYIYIIFRIISFIILCRIIKKKPCNKASPLIFHILISVNLLLPVLWHKHFPSVKHILGYIRYVRYIQSHILPMLLLYRTGSHISSYKIRQPQAVLRDYPFL